ncbi:ABC transporter permease [Candidatus Aerophobetes bacterium]|nr:ABC transporter permease [Candidatus Aerophobetes bacterium]
MLFYVIRRFLYMAILLLLISVVAFVIIQLPPGDYLSSYIVHLQASGQTVDEAQLAALKKQYGLDLPMYAQYFKWMWKMLHGDFGRSFEWNKPVSELIGERLVLTVVLSIFTLLFTYIVAIPIGIYSATHQYSVGDYAFTVIGFAGLATPNFLLALVLMFMFFKYFGLSIGGLFSPQYQLAPWSLAKFVDMLKHLPIPIIVIGTAGTAWLIRVMRGCLLDELRKQYVITARAKGVAERTLLFKYPVRVAINPIISTIGWTLPGIVSGETITAIVLCLPTTGPLLFRALLSQDMYLAGSIVMFLSFLTVIGTFISDLLLVWIDPRIRYEKGV